MQAGMNNQMLIQQQDVMQHFDTTLLEYEKYSKGLLCSIG